MTVFILVGASSDDDGNFGGEVRGIFKTREEARAALKKIHDETLEDFMDPDDCCSANYDYFDISENDDIVVRTQVRIVEKEI